MACVVMCSRLALNKYMFRVCVLVVLRVVFALFCLLVVLCVALLSCWGMAVYCFVFECLHQV